MKVLSIIKRLAYIKLALLALAIIAFGCSATQATILATANAGSDTVFFQSSAKLEFIEGSTSEITGWIDIDPDNLSGEVSGIFRVDLRTLKTSIAKRDEHMRKDHLHTKKYPYAFFEINQLTPMSEPVEAGGSDLFNASGFFYLHGVKRKFKSEFELSKPSRSADKLEYELKANFSILLDEYEIPRPKLLLLKLAKEIEIKIIMKVSTAQVPTEIDLPDFKLAD